MCRAPKRRVTKSAGRLLIIVMCPFFVHATWQRTFWKKFLLKFSLQLFKICRRGFDHSRRAESDNGRPTFLWIPLQSTNKICCHAPESSRD
jgi:hypothetical protein